MKSSFYLYNNVSLAVGIVCSALRTGRPVSMAELSLLLPFLLDDKIVETLQDRHKYVTIRSLITKNNIALGNFNDRYLSLLPLVYQSLSLMLDVDAITISGGMITAKNLQPFDGMIAGSGSEQLRKISEATVLLLKATEGADLAAIYKTLKVEL